MRPEGPLVSQVSREPEPVSLRRISSGDVIARRKKDVVILVQVEDTSDIIAGPIASCFSVLSEVEDFRPDREGFDDFALHQPA